MSDEKFFDQYPVSSMNRPIEPSPKPAYGPSNPIDPALQHVNDQLRYQQAFERHQHYARQQGYGIGQMSSAEEREAVALAESARLRHELAMAERALSQGAGVQSRRADQLASDNEMLGHALTGYQQALRAAWKILRSVSPETFRDLDRGETLGDFSARLPRDTDRSVVTALHASLREGCP